MKNMIAILIVVSTVSFQSLAKAGAPDSLQGKIMSCSYSSVDMGGTQTNHYRFIEDQNGKPVVAAFERGIILPYVLNGTELTIEDPNDSGLNYDISKSTITRGFKSCVFPGEPDGDSRATCEQDTEICEIH